MKAVIFDGTTVRWLPGVVEFTKGPPEVWSDGYHVGVGIRSLALTLSRVTGVALRVPNCDIDPPQVEITTPEWSVNVRMNPAPDSNDSSPDCWARMNAAGLEKCRELYHELLKRVSEAVA